MPLVVKDRIRESTTSTGTGALALAGPVPGFQSFSEIGNGNTTYYTVVDAATGNWEVGIGTYFSSNTTLSRDTVLESSNGGTAVNFAAGVKDVFVTYPAERSVYVEGSTITPAVAATLSVVSGGTGVSSLTGYAKGNGTSAFTASPTIPNTDITGLGTMSIQNANNVNITGGTTTGLAIAGGSINNTPIGTTTANAGTFTNIILNAQGDVRFTGSTSTNWVAFRAPGTVPSNTTWTLPPADGTSGQLLSTNGSGTLSWASFGSLVLDYEDRNDLRALTPNDGDAALVRELGYFVFHTGSTEQDDDETCFATASGRWLLEAVSFELNEAITIAAESTQNDRLDSVEGKFLTGSIASSSVTVAAIGQISLTTRVTGAAVGDIVAVSPGGILDARIAIYARVTSANTVTVYLNNPSEATTGAFTTGGFSVTVIKP